MAHAGGFHGPRCWALSALCGVLLGVLVAVFVPAEWEEKGAASGPVTSAVEGEAAVGGMPHVLEILPDGTRRALHGASVEEGHEEGEDPHVSHEPARKPVIPMFLLAPFGLLLLSIALMPFISAKFWHAHYPDFAFLLGGFVAAYMLWAYGGYGQYKMSHVAIEYYQFMALVVGLYIVSGAIVIDVGAKGRPLVNTLLLGVGAVIANVVGTTGASMLLIRPFMRINHGRLRPIHIVFFIFIVSNCGGCLTPIGDPPLYLGFMRGVPFFWTTFHLWKEWLFVCGLLLACFYVIDSRIPRAEPVVAPADAATAQGSRRVVSITGTNGMLGLAVVVGAVFLDPLLARYAGYHGVPVGPALQIITALVVYLITDRELYTRNRFTFEPAKEVGFLFVGIFCTMAPALAYLAANGSKLGLESPTQYFFFTGFLSAALDNAPTYLTFLQLAFSTIGLEVQPQTVLQFIERSYLIDPGTPRELLVHGPTLLAAISLGAVFFGAGTYIGNGPNFMVKSIAEASGVRMPSFLGYLKYSALILIPVLVAAWALFIRAH